MYEKSGSIEPDFLRDNRGKKRVGLEEAAEKVSF